MNWRIETTGAASGADVDVQLAEDETAEPTPALLAAAIAAGDSLAATLGGEVSVTVNGHETTTGDDFRPAHVTVTVSRLDPDRLDPNRLDPNG